MKKIILFTAVLVILAISPKLYIGTISGLVYADFGNNGAIDIGRDSLTNGVTVTLYRDGMKVAETMTKYGQYSFSVKPGRYVVDVDATTFTGHYIVNFDDKSLPIIPIKYLEYEIENLGEVKVGWGELTIGPTALLVKS